MLGNDIDWTGIENFSLFGIPEKDFKYRAVYLPDAKRLYHQNSYLDAAIQQWEEGRSQIFSNNKGEIWMHVFERAKDFAKTAFEHSVPAKRLMRFLDVDRDIFISDLPCTGAAMERLLFVDWQNHFFNKALDIYNNGYWICGYTDDDFIICQEIPNE